MIVIISPAKKMNVDTDNLAWKDLPMFLESTEELCSRMQNMSYDELKKLWKCNDQIASLNMDRLQHMDLRNRPMKGSSISIWLPVSSPTGSLLTCRSICVSCPDSTAS